MDTYTGGHDTLTKQIFYLFKDKFIYLWVYKQQL